ncbi:hypothetical protein L227DRAFT_150375 [Lentinus tigrinus ALCF2SS1-6]|uniref:Uncharacterized protein n=1 Tax=Lentinus tigrinus ALCF2SS1-6 TaxID=1328759 RepID=A0A5C2SU34_9APHY|nr:hypothetical protein L227DRAFT_150375 [Lentinus tigrinus ALCF2SS1-6]
MCVDFREHEHEHHDSQRSSTSRHGRRICPGDGALVTPPQPPPPCPREHIPDLTST